jgi:hypothetical protein
MGHAPSERRLPVPRHRLGLFPILSRFARFARFSFVRTHGLT